MTAKPHRGDAKNAATIGKGQIDELLHGAVDLNCYCGSSVLHEGLDPCEIVREANDAGMAALVFKDHFYSLTPTATFLAETYLKGLSIRVLSGVALNNAVGDLNRHAVEHSLMLGGRVVWMPTISAVQHVRRTFKRDDYPARVRLSAPTTLTVVDERDQVTDTVKEILDVVAKYDGVLASGHLHIVESWALFKEAKERGVTRLLLNIPTRVGGAETRDLGDFASAGVFIEHCAIDDDEDLAQLILTSGVDQTILGTDPGRARVSRPVDDMRMVAQRALNSGEAIEAVRKMVGDNARRLFGM